MVFPPSIDNIDQLLKQHTRLHDLMMNAALDNDLEKLAHYCFHLSRLHKDAVAMVGRLRVARPEPIKAKHRQYGLDALATRK